MIALCPIILCATATAQGVNDHFQDLYTPPSESGLQALEPFPTSEDVCQVLGENQATQTLFASYPLLIACPRHEEEAIGDRILEGAFVVTQIGAWVVLAYQVALTS